MNGRGVPPVKGISHFGAADLFREPDLRAVTRKPEVPEDCRGSQGCDVLREVQKAPGPHLADPQIQFSVPVRLEGDESTIG